MELSCANDRLRDVHCHTSHKRPLLTATGQLDEDAQAVAASGHGPTGGCQQRRPGPRASRTSQRNWSMKRLITLSGTAAAVVLLLLACSLALSQAAEMRTNQLPAAARQLPRRQSEAIATGARSNEAAGSSEPPSAADSTGENDEEATTTASSESPTTPTTTTSTSTTTTPPPSPSTSKPKIPAVNFTQVEEMFAAASDESEMVAKWRKLDKTLQAGIGQVLKMVFPQVVGLASDAKVSGNCQGAILKWILNLKNLRTWSVQMLDAIGKPSAGLLEGSLTLFGNYKQCLSVRAPDEDEIELADGEFKEYFRGQYCVLQIKPPLTQKRPFYSLNSTLPSLARPHKYYEKNVYDDLAELAMAFNFVNIRADLCVPSLCSRDDIQRVASFLVSKLDMRARVARCDVEPQEDSTQIEQHHVIWSLVFVVLLLLVLTSTLASMVFKLKSRSQKSKSKSIFTSMSVYRSLAHMRDVQLDRINDSKPAFLYSVRIILLLWIFLASLTSQLNFQFLRELLSLRDLIMLWPMQLLVNSSLAFDSLILLTAFTYAYANINANLTDLIKYNVAKWARLMPSIMLLVGLTTITPLLYQWRSPVWHDFVDEPAQNCKSNGLINILFLQNLVLDYNQMCLPWTWLFCVELQLCLLAIPLVYLLNKTFDLHHGQFKLDSLPVVSLLLLSMLGCLLNFLNLYRNQLPAAWFLTFPDRDDKNLYMSQHLQRTVSHLTSFAVGLFAGHLCRCQSIETFSGRPYGRRCCDNLMWLTSALLMGGTIVLTHSWSLNGTAHLEAPVLSALYGALAPLVWSASLSLILFQLTVPNAKNQRSSISKLLTSDVNLIRMGRLSFLAYLINPWVNNLVLAVQEQAIFSSILMLGHTFIGNLVITFALSFVISALVELPCRRLAKKLLGSRRHCSNLDIITRQLDIRHQNQGPSHDSFMANQKHSYAMQQQQQQAAPLPQSVMIPLK